MLNFIFLSFISETFSQSECPVYECAALGENICITWTKDAIQLNSNGCTAKYVCSLEKALKSYALSPDSGSYSCQPSSEATSYSGYNYCGDDISYKKTLKTGSFPKECYKAGYSDYNCLVEDGSYLECRCGMKGKLYCNPNPSSDEFQNFWDECKKNDYIVTAGFFHYYQTLYQFFVEYNSGVECANGLFSEFGVIRSNAPSSGSGSYLIMLGFTVTLGYLL